MNLNEKIQEFTDHLGGELEASKARIRVNFEEGSYAVFVEFSVQNGEIDVMKEPLIGFRVALGNVAEINLERVEYHKESMIKRYWDRLVALAGLTQYVRPEVLGTPVDLGQHDGDVIDLRKYGLPFAIIETDGIVAGINTGAPGTYIIALDEPDFDPEVQGSLSGHIWCPQTAA